jgi:hypothetical protein
MSKTKAQQRKTKAKRTKVAQTVAWKKEHFSKKKAARRAVSKILDDVQMHTTKIKKKDKGFLAKIGRGIKSFFGKRGG